MTSVEEICSHITLINQGHNILSGQVSEIRREYTRGRYSLDFTGDARRLVEALQPVINDFSLSEIPQSRMRLDIRLKDDATLRQAIAAANPIVELTGVNEAMASMNDIFISAVKESNRS